MRSIRFILFRIFFTNLISGFFGESNTKILKNELISGVAYTNDMKPTDNLTIVTLIPNTFILLSMDQQQETIQFSEEFLLTWFDPSIHWDPAKVSYEKSWVKLPASKVWIPDVVFTNAIQKSGLIDKQSQTVDAHFSGKMRTSYPAVISSPCPLRIENFPYDIQDCEITIGPWNFGSDVIQVDTSVDTILPSQHRFEGNSEWELLSIRSTRSDNYDHILNTNFSEITYTVRLKRKPVYYVLVIQAPTFILCTLTLFGLFSPNSQEDERTVKVSLSLNMFAAISMMLNLVAEMMPKASRLPLLGNYIIAEVFVVTAATIASIVTHWVHHHVYTNPSLPPIWLQKLVLFPLSNPPSVCDSSRSRSVQVSAWNSDSPFCHLHHSISETAHQIHQTIEKHGLDSENRLRWLRILDRIDVLSLIFFQCVNITITAIFWR